MNPLYAFVRRHYAELLAVDHWLAEVVGGPPGFTLSSYAYEASTRGKPWAGLWLPVIDWLAVRVCGETEHCRKAYEAQLRAFRSSLAPAAYA